MLELAWIFLKLGATAFGGPAVHIALLEHEVVTRRQWMRRTEFLDLLGATNLIPGPNSTEMAIHIGLRRAGWPGLVVAGTCFIFPAFLIVLACGWFYVTFARLPAWEALLYGVKPVVLAIVFQAIWRLAGSAIRSTWLGAVAIVACAASLAGVHELLLLVVAGLIVALPKALRAGRHGVNCILVPLLPIGLVTLPGPLAGVSLLKLVLFFLKVGSVLYGSGYVLLAFLRADLVDRWGWLTEPQLLDAVAIGQVTPGPVFTTATFIGYQLAGLHGACLATIGIFLPAFFFVAVSARLVPRIRRSPVAGAFLDGVNAASLALMAAVTLKLLGAAIIDVPTGVLGAAGAAVLLWIRPNPMYLIPGAAVVGLIAYPYDG